MTDPFLAEIRIFPYNFAPRGWAMCNGQLMAISQNTALFSLLGTQYGGNGLSTFGLPNFQGSAPVHQGQGPGLSLRSVGESGGSDTVTLISTEMPAHNHGLRAHAGDFGDVNAPSGAVVLAKSQGGAIYHSSTNQDLVAAAAPKTVAAGGLLYKTDGHGRIYVSATNGKTWGPHSDLGSAYTTKLGTDKSGRLLATVGYLGRTFGLVLGSNSKSWLTT